MTFTNSVIHITNFINFNADQILNFSNLKVKCSRLLMQVKSKWAASGRKRSVFYKKHKNWLNSRINLKNEAELNELSEPGDERESGSLMECDDERPSTSHGRPTISYEMASERSKRRKVQDLMQKTCPEQLKKVVELVEKREGLTTMNLRKALALFYDLKLSVRKYNTLRDSVNALHNNMFPSYYALRQFIDELLPTPIIVSDISAEVPLQQLLNRTVLSLLQLCNIENHIEGILECKWGFDGSSGHGMYKQKFNSQNHTDEFIFIVAIVPLKILNQNSEPIWVNEKSSSTLSCRPMKFIFAKENSELVREVHNYFLNEIEKLTQYACTINNYNVNIKYKMHLTMVDGAVANFLCENRASSVCYLCGSKPTEMNSFRAFDRPCIENSLNYGLSTLHAWIHVFECLLHIAYRLPLNCWRVQGKENQDKFKENKNRIQAEFREKMGLNVDLVKRGYGPSNDGNTARRFFENAETSAEITKIDIRLIKTFSLILRIMSCGSPINVQAFQVLLKKGFHIYVEKYSWYYMPATVHKVLVHGIDVIKNFSISIGMLSEEAFEATHKEFRRVRLNNTQKSSREASNKDLFINLMMASDPLILSYRKIIYKKQAITSDIKEYILSDDSDE